MKAKITTNKYTNEKSLAKVQARRLENYAEGLTKVLEDYAEEITPVIQEYNKTSSEKTMALHQIRISSRKVQNRRAHQDMVEGIAVMIAKKLGLEVGVVRIIAKNHDIGHTFFGHDGEEWISRVKQKYDLGIYTHNSIGPKELIYRHQIYDEIIERIVEYNPELTEKELTRIRRSLWIIFDGINSHNGELSETEYIPNREKTELDFEDEIMRCHTEKGYDREIMPATIEGCLIRVCDKIAYTPYDMIDGIREGIIDKIDGEYIEILTELGITEVEIEKANITGEYEKVARQLQIIFAKSVIENSTENTIRMDSKVSKLMHKLRDVNNRRIISLELLREDDETYPEAIESLISHYADLIEEDIGVKELRFVFRHYGTIQRMTEKYKGTADEDFIRYILGTRPEIYDFNEEMIAEVARAKEVVGNLSQIPHERRLALEFGAEYLSTLNDMEFLNLLKTNEMLTEEQLKSLSRTYKSIGREGLVNEKYHTERWIEIQKTQAEATAQMHQESHGNIGEDDDAR